MSARKHFRLGVLFVHGIGAQPSGDTLVRWGDVLVKTIGHATRQCVVATVQRADVGGRDPKKQAEAVLRLCHGDEKEDWLLCEAWWAESFPPPTYQELVAWSLRALPWSIAIHFAQCYWRATSLDRTAAKYVAGV